MYADKRPDLTQPPESQPESNEPRPSATRRQAARSMLTLLGYVVLLIAMWAVLGRLMFPEQSARERLESLVAENENLLIQLAESAGDPELLATLRTTGEVSDLLDECGVYDIRMEGGRVLFDIATESEDTSLSLVYIADGQYSLALDGDWQAATVEENGALRWTGGRGADSYVEATRLTDCFFLEEIYLPDSAS